MKELKPCPFCGGQARILVLQQNGVCIRCTKCEAQTPWTDDTSHGLLKDWEKGYVNSIELSIFRWNRRAYDEQKIGKWERWVSNEDQTNSLWRCTSCGIVVADRKYYLWKYCPNCGAKMETDYE